MKINVRKIIESANQIAERKDNSRHDAIASDAHTIINLLIQTVKTFIGVHIQILNALESKKEIDFFQPLLNQLMELKRNGFNTNNTGPEKGVSFATQTIGVKKTIICNNPGEEQGVTYLGQYENKTLVLYMSDVVLGIKQLAKWYMYINPIGRINKMLYSPSQTQVFKNDITNLLESYNNNIIRNIKNLESLIFHELAHSYDDQQPAKTSAKTSVLHADNSQREKVNAKPVITHADYNNLNSETNAIFFEYLPRFVREYKDKGKDMKTFIPYVKDVVTHNESLNSVNMNKFLSRLYSFLTQNTDEQQKMTINKLEGYKLNKITLPK